MRLLNVNSLCLESFHDVRSAPKYAILSHTWESDEVLFRDVENGDQAAWIDKQGATKVKLSCHQAKKDELQYIWIDTCCIDKSSSSELSEAINSMFQWYEHSTVCYAYLSDATTGSTIAQCRWFSRGWTLQELIAPIEVKFYDKNWVAICTRNTNPVSLASITNINERVLSSRKSTPITTLLDLFTVSERMSWASRRSTTREEDGAYSLLGLFGINMPLLYGEGSNAFQRLQLEIIRKVPDSSIFAFKSKLAYPPVFAITPDQFVPGLQRPILQRREGEIRTIGGSEATFHVVLIPMKDHVEPLIDLGSRFLAVLDCSWNNDALELPALLLHRATDSQSLTFVRMDGALFRVSPSSGDKIRLIGSNSYYFGR